MDEKLSKSCDFHTHENVTLFCQNHAVEICNKCIQEDHKECHPVSKIQDEADGRKGEFADDIKKHLDNLSLILNQLEMDKDNNLTELGVKRKIIEETIREARLRINSYLDKILKSLQQEVKSSYQKSIERVEKEKYRIEEKSGELKALADDICVLEQQSRDRNILPKVDLIQARHKELEMSIVQLAEDDKRIEIHLKLSEAVFSFEHFFVSMGSIIISERPLNSSKAIRKLFYKNDFQSKNAFANDMQLPSSERTVCSLKTKPFGKLTLISSFPTSKLGKGVKIFRACFLPDNTLMLAGYQEKTLYVCNTLGEESRKVRVANFPGGITLYNRTCALVSAWQHGIQKIDLVALKAGEVVKFRGECSAISCNKGQICIKNGDDHLKVVDINGKTIRKMPTMHNPWEIYLTDNGNVFYSNLDNSSVHVVVPDGSNYLIYCSQELVDPAGLTLDNQKNLYISGYRSDNIHRVSSNREFSEIVLTQEDGICKPSGIVFNRQLNQLLIVNDDFTSIRIYQVHDS